MKNTREIDKKTYFLIKSPKISFIEFFFQLKIYKIIIKIKIIKIIIKKCCKFIKNMREIEKNFFSC